MAAAAAQERVVTDYATYEDFLDSQVSPIDLYYLEDEELARQLVELGFRGNGEVLKREEFEARKRAAEEARSAQRAKEEMILASEEYPNLTGFLAALAEREEPNRNGKMMSIIFIRHRNSKGQEVSGYIDLADRLKRDDFGDYFSGAKRLMPRHSDLSFYNWDTQVEICNSTANYQVLIEDYDGLLFKNKRDRKVVCVDPEAPSPGDNSTRTELHSKEYLQVVFYDHVTRAAP